MDNQEQLFDQFADIAALEGQADQVTQILERVKAGVLELNQLGIKIDGSKNVKEIAKALTELEKVKQENIALDKQLEDLRQKYIASTIKSNKLSADETELKRQANKEAKEEARINNTVTGTLENIRARKAALISQRDKIVIVDENSAKQVDALNKRIDNFDQIIKRNSSTVERFKQNVGNYAGSLAGGFEGVSREIARLQRQQETFKIGGDARGAEAAGRQISELNDIIKVSTDNTKSFNQVVKILEKNYASMAASGSQSNEFLVEFKQFVADAKDQASDLRDEIKALASDSRQIDLVVGALNTVIAGAQVVQGVQALGLFGDATEDVQQSLVHLTAIQSVANGVQEIATQLTTKGTAANIVYTGVLNLVSIATDRTATATARLAAITKLMLGGLVLGALAFLVIKLIQLSKATTDAARQTKLLSEVQKEAAKSAGDETAKLQVLYSVATNTAAATKDRKKAVDELQKQYPAYFKNINDEVIMQGKAAAAYEKTKAAILENAMARAIESKLSEMATEELEIDIAKRDALIKKERAESEKRRIESKPVKQFEGRSQQDEVNLGILKNALQLYNSTIEDSNERLQQIGKDREFLLSKVLKIPTDGKEEAKKKDDTAERSRNANFELAKLEARQLADVQKEIVDNENKNLKDRLEALKRYLFFKQEEILLEAQQEIASGKKTAEELKLIEAEKQDKLLQLGKESKQLLDRIRFEESIPAAEKATKEELEVYDKFYKDLSARAQVYYDEKDKKRKDDEAKEKEATETLKQAWFKFAEDIGVVVFDVAAGSFDRRKNEIQDQIDDIEKLKAAEIGRINALTISEEKKAARIKIVEAKAQVDREALERKQKQIDRQKAILDRAKKAFEITISTIADVAKLKTAALLNPGLLPLIPIAIATSAAQLAALFATPLPKFASGKKASDPYVGPGLVGEAGREFEVRANGDIILHKKPTVTHIGPGTTILPNQVTEDILRASQGAVMDAYRIEQYLQSAKKQSNRDDDMMRHYTKEVVKAIENKQMNVEIRIDAAWNAYVEKNIR